MSEIQRKRMPPRARGGANIAIKPSQMLAGEVGLFALRRLPKGTIILRRTKNETLHSITEYRRLDGITKRRVDAFCSVVYDGFFCIADINEIHLGWHCNHSCSPNCGYDREDNIVTMRSIRNGEELCIDYAFVNTHPKWRLKCRCGAPNCRGVVTGNDWKDPVFYRNNQQWMAI